jgi:hypothetical protein
VDTRKDDRAELARLTVERAAMTLTPATAETVAAARATVNAAERAQKAECGNGDPKQRGNNCRAPETTEASARATLATVIANKAATDRAATIDADIRAIRKRLETGTAVANPNPLGAALEAMLGAGAAALTAWQQAIVAAVFELCLVAVMVAIELLGHWRAPPATAGPARPVEASAPVVGGASAAPAAALPPPRKARAKAASTKAGSVKGFFRNYIFPAEDGERVDIKTMVDTYRGWCAGQGLTPVKLDAFLDEIERLCGKLGVRIEPGADQRVYAHGVKIEAPAAVRIT